MAVEDTENDIDKMKESVSSKTRSHIPGQQIQEFVQEWTKEACVRADPDITEMENPYWKTLEQFQEELEADRVLLEQQRQQD